MLIEHGLIDLDKVLVYFKFYVVTLLDQMLRLNTAPVSFFQDDYKQLLCFNRRLPAPGLGFNAKHKRRSVHTMPLVQ